MGILKSFFKSKASPEKLPYEIVEKHLSLDTLRYQVRLRKAGRELYAEELFQTARKPKDLKFGRFFLVKENPPKPHFAPSLKEAVDWFRGRDHPKDGYNTISWGDQVVFECGICKTRRELPLRITAVERLTVFTEIPAHREIVGWRVAEVESELTGKGIPSRILINYKLKPMVIWHQAPSQSLCRNCAQKLTDAGRAPDPADYFVFAAE